MFLFIAIIYPNTAITYPNIAALFADILINIPIIYQLITITISHIRLAL